jgi:Domain of unknown function (DUF4388)
MTLNNNRDALQGLDSLLKRLRDALSRKAEGARYLRSEERSAALCDQARRARHHLQLALDAIQGRPLEEQTTEDPTAEPTGWLRERIGGLVGILSGDPVTPEPSSSPEPARPQAGMLSGDSSALGIPDLIAALHAQGQTGVLRVTQAVETIELHLEQGVLVHAFSHGSPGHLRLGEILKRNGALRESDLQAALAAHSEDGQPLGEALVQGGWIQLVQLEAALAEQVRELFKRLWTRPEARYTFEPGLPSASGARAAWNVTQLLLEGATSLDQRRTG